MVTTHWNQRKHGSKPGLPGDPWNKNTELGKFPKIRIFWIASLGKSLGYFSIFKFSILCHRRTSTSKLKSTTASHIFLVTGFIHHKETANIKTSEALTSRYVFFSQILRCFAANSQLLGSIFLVFQWLSTEVRSAPLSANFSGDSVPWGKKHAAIGPWKRWRFWKKGMKIDLGPLCLIC